MTDTTTALSPEELAAREILDELNASFRFKDSHVESVGGYGEPVWVPNPAVVDIIATAIRQHSADKDRQIEALTKERDRWIADWQGANAECRRLKEDAGATEAALAASLERERAMREALKPFGSGAVVERLEAEDYSVMRERIVDWFGPSDFRAARAALAKAEA